MINRNNGFEHGRQPLPEPNVRCALPGDEFEQFTDEILRGMACNPVYAGLGPFAAAVTDEEWVHRAVQSIDEDGPEQFLVNLLYLLRESFADFSPEECGPDDDG